MRILRSTVYAPFLIVAPLLLADAQDGVQYSRDIRPLLSNRCFVCHGPDVSTREAELRLDTFAFATEDLGGYAAIVPGDLDASEIWYRLNAEDPDERMPATSSHKEPFNSEELALVRAWIESGAKYEEHWAFVPPTKKIETGESVVDAFIASRLAERELVMSPEAKPEELLRRLMLDLTGLPPSLDELDQFLADYSQGDQDAVWAKWVARIFEEEPFASRYAERMATPWMDQARYADTSGIHMDAGRQIWPWRDWVLNAYRSNMPFDQFLTEQLAGDLIPNATIDQIVASGFNRNHVSTDEGGAIDEEYLVEYSVDRVSTTGEVFLGLTMACARCHDHKFDPVTQEDFYRFYSFFNSIDEPGLYSQIPDANRAFEPFIEVPGEGQVAQRAELAASLEATRALLTEPSPEDFVALAEFREALPMDVGLIWAEAEVTATQSEKGADMQVLEGGSVLVSGPNPATDIHHITLRTDAIDLRLLQLDVLGHESLANGAPGRADNGNAVLTSIHIEAVSVADPSTSKPIDIAWAWADFAQENEDYSLLRAFDARPNTGWAIAGHTDGASRSALFLARDTFGYEGGTDIRITLGYESIWASHAFGHVRVGLAEVSESGISRFPLAQGRWHQAGPFQLPSADGAYTAAFGPEVDGAMDPTVKFLGATGASMAWTYRNDLRDETLVELAGGTNITYVGKEIWAPEARQLEVSLGSDDGFALFVNGERVAEREVPRGVAPDQDRATISLRKGRNTVALKVINTGGQGGFYFKALEGENVLQGDLVGALVLGSTRLDDRVQHAWRLTHSPEYAVILEEEAGLLASQMVLEAGIPRTMIMRERAEPRDAFVLNRGEYDKADPARPVDPGVPGFLAGFGAKNFQPGKRASRLDLAHWMTDPENPLVARVAVNRVWQTIFGTGLVSSSGDFGSQGAWPSHPELLDALAVAFIESGWDTRALITSIVASRTYKQSSKVRPAVSAFDPQNSLLANYPRRRLTGEAIRDHALFVSGLLAEKLGGPSVKPYQPMGMWQEIAMLSSNTRNFELGIGDDLWRRSIYTYWKRAAPPPGLLTFDAPTRESCEINRGTTNTPLQALVLWNDEQFVEAARVLADRCLIESEGSDERALQLLFRRCTSSFPDASELQMLNEALRDLRAHYKSAPEEAAALVAIGQAQASGISADELAPWTIIANSILNLHSTITQD